MDLLAVERSCSADGDWSGPGCLVYDCMVEVTNLEFGNYAYAQNGASFNLSCAEGYTESVSSVSCNANSFDVTPSCDPNPCSDKTLDNTTSGSITLSGVYGVLAEVSCATNFVGGGSWVVELMANGQEIHVLSLNVI